MRLAIIFAACMVVTFCIAVTISAGVLTIPAGVTSFTVSVGTV